MNPITNDCSRTYSMAQIYADMGVCIESGETTETSKEEEDRIRKQKNFRSEWNPFRIDSPEDQDAKTMNMDNKTPEPIC